MATLVAWALVSLNEVKEALDISTSDHDARLNGYINRATDIIESYCKRRFISTVYTSEEYSGDGSNRLILRNWPVTALSTVQRRSGSFSSPNWETIDADNYQLNSSGGRDRGIVYSVPGFSSSIDNFLITYTAGYALADMPHDLREACIEMVGYLFNRRKANAGMRSETLGKYSYTAEPVSGHGIIKLLGLETILDLYRTPTI